MSTRCLLISLMIIISSGCTHAGGNVQAHSSDNELPVSLHNKDIATQWHTTSFEPGYLYSIGEGRIQAQSGQGEQAILQAKRAAIDNGYANLLLERNRLTDKPHHDQTSQPATTGTGTQSQSGTLMQVEILKERTLPDGRVQVLMRMPYPPQEAP